MALHPIIGSGADPHGAAYGLAVLLTYLVHGVVWAAAAGAIAQSRSLSSSTRNLLWRLALLGPVVTTLVAAAWPWHAAAGSPLLADVPGAGGQIQRAAAPLASSFVSSFLASHPLVANATAWLGLAGGYVRANRLVLGCAVASVLGVLRFTTLLLALRADVAPRRPVTDARLLGRLESLRIRFGVLRVRLTSSSQVASPLVIGTSEICVPAARLAGLSDAQIDTVLAHELAHLERGDGIWFPLVGLLQSALWLQPINHLVASRLRKSAELACDDRAVEVTGDPWGLASALTEVAAGAVFNQPRVILPTMAHPEHTLLERVRRLVDPKSPRRRDSLSRRWTALLLLTATGLVTLGFSVRVADAGSSGSAAPVAFGRVAGQTDRAIASAPLSAPDATVAGRQLDELLRREQLLLAQLGSVQQTSGAEPGTARSVRTIELQQDLNHVRATQVWLEARFVEEARAWDQRRGLSASR